ncbi:MAG: riboflavin biosynthesis protein RibF [Candidatus Eremiobacteraeota bacterium]|nr:riboflavin biosynthesis protein RibF [Candidatus Eremiobacteraeota bacterium]MBC5803255.1 riboflavin biosynthesis protein RibF [Candidatus Eremiobacteraeota bacterium]MBC5824240.1 riboflavin biosynthesis protein RibF [Candidatus Eremiobacteraeota bacterium]
MKIHHELAVRDDRHPLVVAIGFFDGMHRGHREIVRTLLRCRRPGYRAAVLTFSNHPSTYLRPARTPALITTLGERVNLLAASGIDELYLVPFDERIAMLEARDFLFDVLITKLDARALVVGETFRFGRARAGDVALAAAVLQERGALVMAVPRLTDGGENISSTRIRAALAAGDMASVNRLLGEPYLLRGRVGFGAGRGHDLGFPTANLDVPAEKALPPDGVYAATARYDGRDYRALLSVGTNPTFAAAKRTVEAWLLDFRRTIYGEELMLRDLRFIREQRTFADVDGLLAQMGEDATHVPFPSFSRT